VPTAKLLPRIVRHVWRLRGRLAGPQAALTAELATALDTVIQATPIGRAALRTYRIAMGFVLVVAIALALAGAGVELGFRDSSAGLVVGIVLIALGVWAAWQWWTWSAGLRFLKEHVDPARKVPLAQLPSRFASLGREVAPTSETLGRELEELSRSLDGDKHP
jgi:hypothetical protein